MAEDTGPSGTTAQATDAGAITDIVLSHIAQHTSADAISTIITNALILSFNGLLDGIAKGAVGLGKKGGEILVALEEPMTPVLGAFVTPVLKGLFGVDVGGDVFTSRDNAAGRADASRAIVDAFMAAIEGDAPQPSEPGDDGARRLATAGVHAAIEGWFNAFLTENLADVIPVDWMRLKDVAKLPEDVISALGISRLVRRAIQPLVNATAAQPMTWAANIKYRPTKLGPTTIVRQLARGRWTSDQARAELALAGYTDDRIDALINEQAKFLTIDDLAWMVWSELISLDEAVSGLGDQGYDAQTASKHLNVQAFKREDTIQREIAAAATTAYTDGRIDDGAFVDLLDATIPSGRERDLLVGAARAKRQLRQIHLSPAEAKACVVAGIIPLAEYRGALERDGYVSDAVDALEMLLRSELDKKLSAAQLKTQLAAEKDAAAKVRAADVAAKKAAVEAAAAAKRLGSPAELSRAVVRGLIPIARLTEVLNAAYDADTVAIYVADVEQQRQAYLEQQQKAADAAKRAAAKGLTTGELQTALVDGVLTADQVRQQLAGAGLAAADVAVLLATMQDAAAAHAAAVTTHNQAAARASARSVNLTQAEQLVRAGHWTIAQYNALVASLGYTDAAIADLDQLLNDAIAKDRAGAALRKSVAAGSPAKGLSLAQARQAVILGINTVDQFQTFLSSAGYTADDQATLVAELVDAVAAADAARARRAQATGASDGRAVSLADVTKAARLGIITPAAYQAELVARGYSADEAALEMDLLVTEIAATAAAQTAAPATGAAPASKGLTLGELAAAVKAGAASIDDYRARATALGYSPTDVQTLTTVLVDQVDTLALAQRRHVTIDGELAARSLSIAEVEAAVKAGTRTLDDYEQWLLANGYGAADAALLRALLESKL